ncbi:MAG TPA: hypothetical protein DCY27_10420 [Desulfobacterales bacterium]|nr:hypothetical protein [Desulfobacterales bacterium]
MYSWGFISSYACGSALKKTPALTLPQAHRLVVTVLPLHALTFQGAIELVKYHTRRNDIAYKSHRKKRLAVTKMIKI